MAPASMSSSGSKWLNRLLAAATLLSAWLLFQVQPMAAKRILPWFGGGAGVWTSALLFFQTALLAGYAYSHLVARRLSPRLQVLVHSSALVAATALLAVRGLLPADVWKPVDGDLPASRILAMLLVYIGAPYVLLAATSPLVQVWFARTNPNRSPYRLYALSNVGSLAALLSYPFLIEPHVGIARQGLAWAALFAVFAAALIGAGALSLVAAAPVVRAAAARREASRHTPDARPRWLQFMLWLALPACASVALMAITDYLSQDVASFPLLWILPLATYLVSFILTFDSDRWYVRWFWLAGLAALSYAAVFTWSQGSQVSLRWQVAGHIALLFCLCMACHGELARLRPPAERLTSFYLCLSAGGALGGFLVAVAAPMTLPDRYELQLGILAAWLLVLVVLVTDRQSIFFDGGSFRRLLAMGALLVGLVVSMVAQALTERKDAVDMARNFYGVLELSEIDRGAPYYLLLNGRISHGAQYQTEENRRVPSQYYHVDSGVGELLSHPDRPAPRHVGIVGLGAGTLAAYAEKGDHFTFYEINPQVVEFAEKYFTYLADARERGATITIVPGDARLALERQEPQEFDALVLDAFTGDAIPIHLLTREAFELYLRHLKQPGGVLAVHMSNLHLDLAPVLRGAMDRFDFDATGVDAPADGSPAGQRSIWVLLSREPGYLASKSLGKALVRAGPDSAALEWTDDYSNVLDILK